MKKMFGKIMAFAICAVFALGLVGCSEKDRYILPEIVYDGDGALTVEHVTNIEADYVLYENKVDSNKSHILKHADFEEWGSIQYAWVIKNGDGDIIGWISLPNAYWINNKDRTDYAYGLSHDGKKFGDGSGTGIYSGICVYLLDNEIKEDFVKNHVTFTSDVGNMIYNNFAVYSGDPYCVVAYSLDLSGVNPKTTKQINLKFGIHE